MKRRSLTASALAVSSAIAATGAFVGIQFASAPVASAAGSAVSRFDDGSFETPKVAPNTFQTFTAGEFVGPWKVTSGSVDVKDAGYWQAAEGDQSLDLNGTETGAVSQTFATNRGSTYTVTYSLAGNSDGQAPTPKTGKVLIDGQNVQDFSFDATGKTHQNMGYVTREVGFVATGSSTTLTFASTTPHSAGGPVIDDVQVERCKSVCCPSDCGD
ncbi:choice-of-anchor C family protein [Streptomyces piniterrae]|uniref:Choice-of-anchor C family protein n=1 Tax=Streptomyces piniterrae TaxID=2571125 RepID=A0A4U0NR82_9ACTN|nr:choice-of-anchor C family protein [Streptomyces piniterrae]TJZ57005.1 choice-of-anchor C family protein [Streptomyces piniterrae]